MYNKVEDLVGIDKSSGKLMSIIQSPQLEGASDLKTKIVVIVGVGGLGKTTLAKAVYDKLKEGFDCTAFVPVGRKPNPQQVIQGILIGLDKKKYMDFNFAAWHRMNQFIDELRMFLQEKRYLIVIDDLWEKESWEIIKLAFDDNNCGSRIIITTRNRDVSEKGYEVYDLPPLPYDSSRKLFYTRIYGDDERPYVDNKPDKISDELLRKCAGIPLAIITMASLLVGKPEEKWLELYRSIGFGYEDNNQGKNTMRIVSFSYYDLPAHLRTCLLYLSAFPEDSFIDKESLVWNWVAEGFVEKKQGMRLFEVGGGYFNALINRSMIQAVKSDNDDNIIVGCRVHDMVLDFIRSKSCEENFFTVLGNDEEAQHKESNVIRRLAHHNRILGHAHRPGDHLDKAKVRSFVAIQCVIKTWAPFHGLFTLLRVLAIEDCRATDRSSLLVEHVGHLLHLRLLRVRGTFLGHRIPDKIGGLRFLQTLDLYGPPLDEWPPTKSLPEQLVCLRFGLMWPPNNVDMFSLRRMTSLEELQLLIYGGGPEYSWPVYAELGYLTLLRVVHISILCAEAVERDFWRSVGQLSMLEHLTIFVVRHSPGPGPARMHVTDFILPRLLRHLAVRQAPFCKLPPCVNASCVPNLSHLELTLEHMDEQDLKILGRLPELRFLDLRLRSSATISNVVVVSGEDGAVVYFPKLWCCKLTDLVISFRANQEDKSISFHVSGGELCNYMNTPSVSNDESQPAGGRTGGGAPRDRVMPCLQVLRLQLQVKANWDHRFFVNLGWEHGLPSLRKIYVDYGAHGNDEVKMINAEVKLAAKAHPNRPPLLVRLV